MKEYIQKVRDLLQDPNKWIQGDDAIDIKGGGVDPTDPNACKWCLMGAFLHFKAPQQVRDYIHDLCFELKGTGYGRGFNDTSTHEQVISLLDKALERYSNDKS